MANQKISDLTALSPLTGTEYVEVQDGASNKKVLASTVKTYANTAPTQTGTTTVDRIKVDKAAAAANPTTLDWTATTDDISWTFSAGQTITVSNAPSGDAAQKTIRASASSGGPHTLVFTGATVLPTGDSIAVPASGTTIITLDWDGTTLFVSQRIGIEDVLNLQAALDLKAPLASPTFTGTTTTAALTAAGNVVSETRKKVMTSVTGSLSTASHSGNILKTSGNISVPNAAGDVGFNALVIAGGAHTISFNSTTTAALAAGDIVSLFVESTTVIHAAKTAAADKLAFS